MAYYHYDDDDGDVILEVIPDDDYEYRNAVRVQNAQRQNARRADGGWYDRRYQRARRPGPVVVRHQPRPQPRPQQIVVQQPAQVPVPAYQESGLMVGGVRVSLGALAGTMLTLGGLGVQLASHFVDKPTPPSGELETGHLVEFQQEKDKSERKIHMLESIGRALSDLGQLTAFKSNV